MRCCLKLLLIPQKAYFGTLFLLYNNRLSEENTCEFVNYFRTDKRMSAMLFIIEFVENFM